MSASRVPTLFFALAATALLPGCGLIGAIGFLQGTQQFHARMAVCESYQAWLEGCGLAPEDTGDTGYEHPDLCPFMDDCSSSQIGRFDDWVECAQEEGCDLHACEAKLEKVKTECRPEEVGGY